MYCLPLLFPLQIFIDKITFITSLGAKLKWNDNDKRGTRKPTRSATKLTRSRYPQKRCPLISLLCLSVCVRAQFFGLRDPWDMRKKRLFFAFRKFYLMIGLREQNPETLKECPLYSLSYLSVCPSVCL